MNATNTTDLFPGMTKAELLQIADDRGVEIPKRATKAQVIELLLAWEREQAQANTDADTNTDVKRTMHALRVARKHYTTTTVGRKASIGCGDELQVFLAPLDHVQVARIAGAISNEDLLARYAHLNNGQIRMNCGNRIRGSIKRGDYGMEWVRKVAHDLGIVALELDADEQDEAA